MSVTAAKGFRAAGVAAVQDDDRVYVLTRAARARIGADAPSQLDRVSRGGRGEIDDRREVSRVAGRRVTPSRAACQRVAERRRHGSGIPAADETAAGRHDVREPGSGDVDFENPRVEARRGVLEAPPVPENITLTGKVRDNNDSTTLTRLSTLVPARVQRAESLTRTMTAVILSVPPSSLARSSITFLVVYSSMAIQPVRHAAPDRRLTDARSLNQYGGALSERQNASTISMKLQRSGSNLDKYGSLESGSMPFRVEHDSVI